MKAVHVLSTNSREETVTKFLFKDDCLDVTTNFCARMSPGSWVSHNSGRNSNTLET